MIVADASVLVPALCDGGNAGHRARARLSGETVAAPELVDLECLSAIRGLTLSRTLTAKAAETARSLLASMPIRRTAHVPLLDRCWELRTNLTVYGASYVAVAEHLGVGLVTADARLGHAPGVRCPVEIVQVGT